MKPNPARQKAIDFMRIIVRRFTAAEVTHSSVMIAYYLLLSLFPLLIAVGNILPYLNIDVAVALDYINVALPPDVQNLLDPVITGLLTNSNGGLLSISLVGAIWTSSRGINFLQKGVNKAYGLQNTNIIVKRLVSLVTITLILLLLVAFVLAYSLGEMLLEGLSPHFTWADTLLRSIGGLKWPVTLVFIFLLLLIVYRVTPDVKLTVGSVVPGALFATVGLTLLVQGFALIIRVFTRYLYGYGALGTFFVLMFWLNFTMMIVLVGAVLNASIHEYRHGEVEEDIGPVDLAIEKAKESILGRLKAFVTKKQGKAAGGQAPAANHLPEAPPAGPPPTPKEDGDGNLP